MPGHGHAAAGAGEPLMHGMATDEEMRRLRDARGAEAEVLFLQLMIRHHEGGVVMAACWKDCRAAPKSSAWLRASTARSAPRSPK